MIRDASLKAVRLNAAAARWAVQAYVKDAKAYHLDRLVCALCDALVLVADLLDDDAKLAQPTEDDDDPLAADRRDPAWAWAETELTAIAYALLDNADQPQQPDDDAEEPDDEPEQPDDEPEQPDDEPEQPDDEPEQPDDEPASIRYVTQELRRLRRIADEWMEGYEALPTPDESDHHSVLVCLEEHQAMIGRCHYLTMELLKLRLEASEDDQPADASDGDDDWDDDDEGGQS